jgi:hypothetical protein
MAFAMLPTQDISSLLIATILQTATTAQQHKLANGNRMMMTNMNANILTRTSLHSSLIVFTSLTIYHNAKTLMAFAHLVKS